MAWQIYELTDSPLQIGMLGLVGAVPQLFILLFGGLSADAILDALRTGFRFVMGDAVIFPFSSRISAQILSAPCAHCFRFTRGTSRQPAPRAWACFTQSGRQAGRSILAACRSTAFAYCCSPSRKASGYRCCF
jgi:hypothetical protein